MRRSLAALVMAAQLVLSSAPALAGPTSASPAAAQKAFDAGQDLFDKGRHEEAIAKFREAYSITKSPNARLMVARSLLALGKMVEAYEELSATRIEAATLAEQQPKYERARDSAAADLAALEPKVAKVIVALAQPEGARVTLNGTALPAERLGVAIVVLPGKVVVEVEPAKGAPMHREEVVVGGQTKTIFVAPGAEAPKTEPSAPAPAASTTGGGVRIAGYVVAGLGVVGLGVFGVTTAMAQSKYDGLVADCGGKRCTDPRYADVIDEGKRLETIALGSLVGGAVGVAAGALMITLGGPKAAKKTDARVVVGPGGAFVEVGGAF
ncbi:CDC27 family protein [Polyangium sp. 15x6]|uniref:CDC27 family protein n=1 Tax=Polyangium sp. 15x6 TaxID=3042687 RepID=UPI00249A3F07|nr:CDC27 family protein [Polyangium sp. 15x6]MDI3284589.1 CDC27 family protein [Polyangium sp. 15x6]